MNERDFLLHLQERAREQERAMRTAPFPKLFAFVVVWLSHHPWRFLIPLAFLISIFFREIFGPGYTDFILLVFRGL